MEIIPVVDLKGGRVVHARRGQRHAYRPIVSALAGTAEPAAVLGAIVKRYAPRTVYIADLDAIEGTGNHRELVAELTAACPPLTYWLDAGYRQPQELRAGVSQPHVIPVVGSETLADMQAYRALREVGDEFILSLDFQGGRLRGPGELLRRPDLWPRRIIRLDLDRVGAVSGPDIEAVRQLAAATPERQLYAGGGVRHADDLSALARAGASGALVATALHDGSLSDDDLIAIQSEPTPEKTTPA
jgi:phosphoribosylformimino-5-aminoimidazole carboxamide ribotide isomerase